MLQHLFDRLSLATAIDRVIIATSVRAENDVIAAYCDAHRIDCFRGEEHDVLGRTLGALHSADASTGIVVFGDGPLIDARLVDQLVAAYSAGEMYDFVGNDLTTTYPPGMEVEVFSVAALSDANRACRDPAIREHGTLHIRTNPDRYRLLSVEAPPELRRPDLELEIDELEDLGVIEAVLSYFKGKRDFSLSDIITFLNANPGIVSLNRDVPRRWRAYRSPG